MTVTELLIQYASYVAIIIIGFIVLWFIKKATKLPSHTELKRRIVEIQNELNSFLNGTDENRQGYDFFKKISKCLYSVNKMIYLITLVAQKERDGELDGLSVKMEKVRSLLSPYKFKTKTKDDMSGIEEASAILDDMLNGLEQIIKRDHDLGVKQAD